MSGADSKRRLRRRMRELRRGVSGEEARSAAVAVADALEAWPPFVRARRVALYAALPDELPTRPIFERLRAGGRPALLPRMADPRRLVFCPVDRWEDLRPGRYGVLQPPVGCPEGALGDGDCVLLPGVAFDARGRRLGRGGGFYDAAFPVGRPASRLVGVGYEFQVVEEVPAGPLDRAVDAIVTERGLREAVGS